ncbi:hypothetical protein P7K49_005024 [Saguinus oedipus]|uniref:Uncharacterized protein n=1 Tax=Saguinus oedipus TaxID=9490 RepID=A0ABQ9W948_SAGOE|nr:hypothetical protein P7K49_005024 [Saguinus oedipus]
MARQWEARAKKQQVEHNSIDDAVSIVSGWNQHEKEDHKLRIGDQKPGDDGTSDATALMDKHMVPTGPRISEVVGIIIYLSLPGS